MLALVAALMLGASVGSDSEAFRRAVEELRAAGYPTSFAEQSAPQFADECSGLVPLATAFAGYVQEEEEANTFRVGLESLPHGEAWLDDPANPWRARVAETLRRHGDLLEAAVEASSASHLYIPCRATGVWARSFDALDLQDAARLLGALGHLAETRDDRVAATESLLRLGARLEVTCAGDAETAVRVTAAGTVALRRALVRGDLTAAHALSSFGGLLTESRLQRWPQAARGEIAAQVESWNVCFGEDASALAAQRRHVGLGERLSLLFASAGSRPVKCPAEWTARDVALSLDVLRRLAETPLEPWTEFARRAEPLLDELIDSRLRAPPLDDLETPRAVVLDLARRRVTLVALAAMARHERTGSWPESLDSLAGDLPEGVTISPIDGGPLGYSVDKRLVRVSANRPAPSSAPFVPGPWPEWVLAR